MKVSSTKLPDKPGVYLFKKGRSVLYVGKATSLRDRVRSYFGKDLMETRGPKLVQMIGEATDVDYQETRSVLEALVLEANLIKKYQPRYNTREKDDRSFNYVVITKEDFPRLLVVRGKDLIEWSFDDAQDKDDRTMKYKFGPFTQASELRSALKIIRKIFPYRDKCEPFDISKGLGDKCFNAQIGLCPGVCDGSTSKEEYAKTIKKLRMFFDGNYTSILQNTSIEMKEAVRREEFEKAAVLRNQIFALEHVNDVALIRRDVRESDIGFRIEGYDIAHISGTDTVGAMVVMEDGLLAKHEYKRFKLKGKSKNKSDDTGNLKEVLERRFKHVEWPKPDLVVIDGSVAQRNVAEAVVKNAGVKVEIVNVVKDDKHKPKDIVGKPGVVGDYRNDILLINQEAHRFVLAYHRSKRDRIR